MVGYGEKHFTENGRVWLPIMGEYEFSRTERAEWEKGIAKMKALGCKSNGNSIKGVEILI